MARQTQSLEVSSFVKGLITEASALTFPDNASLDEDNFNLRRDGSRDRRLGIDFEKSHVPVETNITSTPEEELAVSTFSWENVGGRPDKVLVVVQTGSLIKLFNPDNMPLSGSEVFSYEVPATKSSQVFSFANIDGTLVVASGSKAVTTIEPDGGSFKVDRLRIKTRDTWGVEFFDGGQSLFSPSGLSRRPSALGQKHAYNLRNQTWAPPREAGKDSSDQVDTLAYFAEAGWGFPSNSDNINYALYPNPSDESNRTGDQFFRDDLIKNPPGSFPAPRGYFIIDTLDRGRSRVEEAAKLYNTYGVLQYPITSLPADSTPGGPTCVAEYAGRAWYAGFSGETIDGDSRSPTLSSYVFYSQLVNHPSKLGDCFQEGDPTSKEGPDLVDTDGGYIRVDGAYNIQKLVEVGAGLMVVAENGIWMISGGSDYGFTANNNMRIKISDRGAQSVGSVVKVDSGFFYWADDAIYKVGPNQFGDYESQNLTQTTIQKFYDAINPVDKLYAQGKFDTYDMKVRWVYQNRIGDQREVKELIFDLNLGAFYTHTIQVLSSQDSPKVMAPVEVPPFRLNQNNVSVVFGGEEVVYEGEPVGTIIEGRTSGTRELSYVALTKSNPLTYTFARYQDSSFRDWVSVDGEGKDAPAYLITGYASGGDFLRYKQVPYVQFFFSKTETGFEKDSFGNLFALNPSSCKVQAQWEWANSPASNRWGREFQAYRHKRHYIPSGPDDVFDNGFEVVTSKSKLRGKGRVLSLHIKTEPEKDCRLLGWSMVVGVTGNV